MLVLLLGICAATRIVYFVQAHQTTFAEMHRWAESDMHYYHSWSDKIAKGDWLSEGLHVPQAEWHVEVVVNHIETTPDALERLQLGQRPEGITPAAYVWGKWMGLPAFYQDGLYPYLMAATAVIAGTDVRWVFGWQLVIGVAATLLLWDVSRRCFGDAAGAVAGGLAALCGPLMYYELLLLRDSSLVGFSLLIAWASQRAGAHASPRGFLLTGGVVGLATLLKSSVLLFALGIPAGLWLFTSGERSRRIRCTCAFLLGVAAGLVPLAARNVLVGVPPLTLASSGPFTFVAANEPMTRPEQGNYINSSTLARFLGRTDGGWRAAINTALDGHTFASYLMLMGRKLSLAWHWFEIPNNDNFYHRRLGVPILQWLPVTAWFIAPLALVGLVLGWRRRRDAWPLYMLVVAALTPLLVFYVIGRFRVVLLAGAIPFAALTIVTMAAHVRSRRWQPVSAIVLAVCAVGVWTARPLDAEVPQIRVADWLLPYTVRYQPQMRAAGERGDFAGAARSCEQFFADAPALHDAPSGSTDPALPPTLADIRLRCAALWSRAGDEARAAAQAQLAEALRATPRR